MDSVLLMKLDEVDVKYPHSHMLLNIKVRSFLITFKLPKGEE